MISMRFRLRLGFDLDFAKAIAIRSGRPQRNFNRGTLTLFIYLPYPICGPARLLFDGKNKVSVPLLNAAVESLLKPRPWLPS